MFEGGRGGEASCVRPEVDSQDAGAGRSTTTTAQSSKTTNEGEDCRVQSNHEDPDALVVAHVHFHAMLAPSIPARPDGESAPW